MKVQWKWKLHLGLFGAKWILHWILHLKHLTNLMSIHRCFFLTSKALGERLFPNRSWFYSFLYFLNLQWEHKKPREGGVLPSSHQVPPLQFEVSLVPSLHYHQPGVGGSFPGHILVTCEGRDHRPAIESQTHLWKRYLVYNHYSDTIKSLRCCSYLYRLSVVNFNHVKAETVNSFSGGHEDTSRRVKMAANVY